MGINFSNGLEMQEVSGRISMPGHIIQTVQTNYTSQLNTSSTSPVDFFTSGTITLSSASNRVLIEFHSDNRFNDWTDGNWSLYYMDLIHVQSGTQLTYTGYIGEYTYNIRHVHRTAIHAPGSVGPHSYKVRCWNYQSVNVTYNGGGNQVDNDGIAYIRMTEIRP